MNIKSLLIGSTAALVAVSGARAADAVVAEPEAVEYVRVCDAFGSGYFYIPGTETCLKISGYVRYDIGFGELNGADDAFKKRARLSLRTSTKAETELGTLTTYTETRFNFGTSKTTVDGGPGLDGINGTADDPADRTFYADEGANSSSLNFAYIELGGLRIGKDESAFTTWTGYAGSVIADDQVSYGPFDTTLISYTFTGSGGFSAILSLEDDNATGEGYVPDVVAGAKYTVGDFGLTGVVGYDESKEEFGGKLRADAKFGKFSVFVMGGYGTDDTFSKSRFKPWGGNWAIWGGASVKASDKIGLNLQLAYDEAKTFAVAANVVYEIVPGYKVTTEVDYTDKGAASGKFGGTVRFQRSF